MVQKCRWGDVSRIHHRLRTAAILDASARVEAVEAVAAEQTRRGVVERFIGALPVVSRRVRFHRYI